MRYFQVQPRLKFRPALSFGRYNLVLSPTIHEVRVVTNDVKKISQNDTKIHWVRELKVG